MSDDLIARLQRLIKHEHRVKCGGPPHCCGAMPDEGHDDLCLWDALREAIAALSAQGETAQQAPDAPPFVDTPLLAAKRRAFDDPSQANLDALIVAAQGETAPAPVDEHHICTSHRALMSAADGCPWCEVAKVRLAAASPLPPGEALEELARETAEWIVGANAARIYTEGRVDDRVEAASRRILTALRRAVSEGRR